MKKFTWKIGFRARREKNRIMSTGRASEKKKEKNKYGCRSASEKLQLRKCVCAEKGEEKEKFKKRFCEKKKSFSCVFVKGFSR